MIDPHHDTPAGHLRNALQLIRLGATGPELEPRIAAALTLIEPTPMAHPDAAPFVREVPRIPVVITREAKAMLEEHRRGDGWLENPPVPLYQPGKMGVHEGTGLWLVMLSPAVLLRLNEIDVDPSRAILKAGR